MIQNIPPLGILIILVNVIVSLRGFKDDIFFNKYRFEIRKLREGDYFRLLGSGFLHVNTTHLLFNMMTFYFFVSFVFSALGTVSYTHLTLPTKA